MKKKYMRAIVVLFVLSTGWLSAGESRLKAVYANSGRTLESVQDAQGKERVAVGSPLWLVGTREHGVVSALDFIPAGEMDSAKLFVHKKSGLSCSVTTQATGTFIRHFYTLTASKPVTVEKFSGLVLPPGFSAGGSVPGSPLITGDWFAGMEYPTAHTEERLSSEIGRWDASMLEPKMFKELSWPVPDDLLKDGLSLNVHFSYTSGWSRMDIRRVALMKGTRLVAEDVHAAFAGTPNSANIFKLSLESLTPGQRSGLRIVADVMVEGESNGVIHLEGGKLERITQSALCDRPLEAGDTLSYSSVIGHAVYGSLRRGVLEYIEACRARKYKPYLHYNSWYDICEQGCDGLFVMDSDQCLGVMKDWEREFVKPYGIKIEGFVFDDGWDDFDNLWSFHPERFPKGFSPQAELAREMGTHIGTWFSPFGGYGATKQSRLKSAKRDGYEINASGLSLSGEKYYGLFYEKCAEMITKYEVNSFKFDGVGGGPSADMEAACRLMAELRKLDPDLYINLTSGTWGSPFFLLHGDSIWRGGGDANTWGDRGPTSHRWMNYRDGETYNNIVKPSPLFPLNSLMLCGMVYSQYGLGRVSVDKSDQSFADQAYSFFASGTQLQELYMSTKVMDKRKWNILAAAVKWAHANAETLRDTHWVGGNPYKYEIYGHASFDYRGVQEGQPYKAILSLRNPSEKTVVFELPLEDVTEWKTEKIAAWEISRRVHGLAPAEVVDDRLKITLAPFSVEVMELNVKVSRFL